MLHKKAESLWTQRHHILVIQHNVRNPDGVWGNSDGGDSQVIIWIPSELHVCPLLSSDRKTFTFTPHKRSVGNTGKWLVESRFITILLCSALPVWSTRWWSSAGSSHPNKWKSSCSRCLCFGEGTQRLTTSTSWEMASPNFTRTVPFRSSTGLTHFW